MLGGRRIDPAAQLLDLDRVDCEESLYEFLKGAWAVYESHPWVDGWCIDAMAEHIQAVVDGQITRLIINIPPRCGKSALCSVALPAWAWAQPRKSFTSGPGVNFLYASFSDDLSRRDSVFCRTVIRSNWYQERWGDRYQLSTDQDTKGRFQNDKGGQRLITTIGAITGGTGSGGDIIVVDDANSAGEIESEAAIEKTINWWTGTMGTRLNDAKYGAYIEIQQRLGESDLTGHIIEHEIDDWVHLMLPMRYEPERSYHTVIGWKDPRTEPGELLWPERFDEVAVKRLEKKLGPWRAAGQLQQRPEPKGGGVIKRDWWQLWTEETFPAMDYIMAYVDTAYTEKTINDPSAMIVWGVFSGDTQVRQSHLVNAEGERIAMNVTPLETGVKVMMMHAWTERLELNALVQRVAKSAKEMKIDALLIENKASGISVAQEIRRLYGHEKFAIQLNDPKSQDKLARLYSVQHFFEDGMIYAPERSWSDMVITQVGQFPRGRHDDLVDCCSGALRHLRDIGLIVRAAERLAEIEDRRSLAPTGNRTWSRSTPHEKARCADHRGLHL